MGQKGTGRRLSDQERMEIIAKLEGDKPRASAAECARQYGVSSAAITKLMKMKDKIKQRFNQHNSFSQQRKRGGTERHAAFEDELFQWIQQQQQAHVAATAAAAAAVVTAAITPMDDPSAVASLHQQHQQQQPPATAVPPLTSAKVQERAQELLKTHDLGAFRASKGWYYRFCRRFGLSRSSLSPDDGDRDDDDDDAHGLDQSGSESDGSFDHSVDGADGGATRKHKRKDGMFLVSRKKSKVTPPPSWAVQSLQETLVKAAVALDHPDARQYLGEPAAGEMLRSIQQSIGVVQCIRLKKTTPEASEETDALPTTTTADEATTTIDPIDQTAAASAASDREIDPEATTTPGSLGPMEDVIV